MSQHLSPRTGAVRKLPARRGRPPAELSDTSDACRRLLAAIVVQAITDVVAGDAAAWHWLRYDSDDVLEYLGLPFDMGSKWSEVYRRNPDVGFANLVEALRGFYGTASTNS